MPAKARVLVVEDELLVREMVCEELKSAGYCVLDVEDGAHALDALAGDRPIDVLFTDIRLPGAIDGWAIARRARAMNADLPVIYATGYALDRAAEVPRSIFMRKPYQLSDVVDAIERALRQTPQA